MSASTCPALPRVRVSRCSAASDTSARSWSTTQRATRIVAASTTEPALRSVLGDANACTTAGAAAIGKTISERAKAAGVDTVVFDRAGYLFHGRVKALAEAAREGGLKF